MPHKRQAGTQIPTSIIDQMTNIYQTVQPTEARSENAQFKHFPSWVELGQPSSLNLKKVFTWF